MLLCVVCLEPSLLSLKIAKSQSPMPPPCPPFPRGVGEPPSPPRPSGPQHRHHPPPPPGGLGSPPAWQQETSPVCPRAAHFSTKNLPPLQAQPKEPNVPLLCKLISLFLPGPNCICAGEEEAWPERPLNQGVEHLRRQKTSLLPCPRRHGPTGSGPDPS